MKTYYYIANVWSTDNIDIEDASEYDSSRDIKAVKGGYDEWEVEWLVNELAEYYYDNRDGWEIARTWQDNGIRFALWDSDKNYVGLFDVALDFSPSFNAMKVYE